MPATTKRPAERKAEADGGVEEFLYREAELLDRRDLQAWLKLFQKDARYWIASGSEDSDPTKEAAWAYDDVVSLENKIWRIESGGAHAQDPPSQTCHLITNIRVRESGNGKVVVTSNMVVYELRKSIERAFPGHCEHHLVREGGGWKIALKKMVLLARNEPIFNLTFMM